MTFVDTSAICAVLDRDDQNHKAARDQWLSLLDSGETMLTTNYVAVECCALLQHRLGVDAVRAFQEDVLPAMKVHWISEMDHTVAMAALLAARRRKLSLVDCSSFVIMRQAHIRTAFAFDQHFAEEGFSPAHSP